MKTAYSLKQNLMNHPRTFTIILSIVLSSVFSNMRAQENNPGHIQIGIFADPGISSTYGDYPSEYNASPEFSISAGVRARLNQAFGTNMMLAADFGFIEIAYRGFVDPTDSYIYTTYDFLTFNFLAGVPLGPSYAAGGFYFAKSLGGNQYKEYTDKWVSLSQKSDIGLLAEMGVDLGKYISLGVQGRVGIPSIGSSIDIKTWALHAKLGINIFRIEL